ncbi:MAG: tetraacyldisaccharide 4'-kinase [Desulfomonile tiedjei]|nr:tetraacyldisaccharide 4'-kinase [Desulfomonile tiedjei]
MGRRSSPIRGLLFFPAACYYAVQRIWAQSFAWGIATAKRASVPVISVGNLLMGGSGKTPMVIFLAEMLRSRGMRPAVISRGYRGSSREPYLVVSDGRAGPPLVRCSVAGDEPYLMAQRLGDVPVVIGRKRIHPVEAAARLFGCDVAVLDDGFQHLELQRDVDIVLLSGTEDSMFPMGRLREPFSALARADIAVLTSPDAAVHPAAEAYLTRIPVFRSSPVALSLRTGTNGETTLAPDVYAGREVVLASAIADPDRFRTTVEKLGWIVAQQQCFPDHHRFTDRDMEKILEASSDLPVVVTEKDWVKIPDRFKRHENLAALAIDIRLDDEAGFMQALASRLNLRGA